MKYAHFPAVIFASLMLGCATPDSDKNAAPVVSMNQKDFKSPLTHTVRKGDTIYSIAWMYDKDYKEVAKLNHIPFPYVIRSGQTLKLSFPKHMNHIKNSPAQTVRVFEPVDTKQAKITTHSRFMWPVAGKVVQGFSDTGNPHKGIDIVNEAGTPVFAAEKGKVVYSGQGLRGYGKLLIIKHDKAYLSAYAHNAALFVNEGDPIDKGQKIASMGSTESEFTKLHFEIRKNGQPIDPLEMLPPR